MNQKDGLEIIVVGTGMYVCGRYTDGYGTVLPAIYQWEKTNLISKVHIAGTSPESIRKLKNKQEKIENHFGTSITTKYYPTKKTDRTAYLDAISAATEPCCAIVVVPDHLHAEVTTPFIEAGIPPLVVKPLAPTTDEVDKLIELKNENDVFAAVEFHKRFDRSNRLLKDAYRNGDVGDPLYFLVQYSQRKSVPEHHFKQWVEQTNIFQYLGPHYVDIIHWITGAEPVRVRASGQKNYLKNQGYDTYDAIEAMVEWELPNGSQFESIFLINWVDPESTSAMSDQRIKLIGTKGRIEADQKRRGIKSVTDNDGIKEPNPDFCRSYGLPGDPSFSYEGYGIDSFIKFFDAVYVPSNSSHEVLATFEEALVSTEVVEKVNHSLSGIDNHDPTDN